MCIRPEHALGAYACIVNRASAGHPMRVMRDDDEAAHARTMSSSVAGQDGDAVTLKSQQAAESAEVERLRAETAALQHEVHRLKRRRDIGGMWRRFGVGLLVVLFAILVPVAVTATWAHRTVMNTGAWTRTTDPIASDPAVTAAISRQVTDQIYQSLDPQQVIANALPTQAAFLAGPIANGAKSYVQQGVNNVLSSDQFQTLWKQANQFAHTQLVTVLRGDSKVLQTTNGQVVLNLVPVVNAALQSIEGFASNVVGKPINLPTISGNELPSAACEKISAALDRPVPSTCGQIALFPADKLTQAQRAVRAFDRGVLALLIVTPIVFAVALWLSRRRRRTLLQLAIGASLGLVIVRRATMWLQSQLIAQGKPENKDARSAIVHQVLHGFFTTTMWVLIAALIIVVVALVTGPYRWAARTREGAVHVAHLTQAAVSGTLSRTRDQEGLVFVRDHFDLLRAAGVVVALFLVLIFSVNGWGLLIIAALLVLYEVGLYRLRPPAAQTAPSDQPPGGPPPVGVQRGGGSS